MMAHGYVNAAPYDTTLGTTLFEPETHHILNSREDGKRNQRR
jgi:hypothetical protein